MPHEIQVEKLRDWTSYLLEGIALICIGVFALTLPVMTTLALTIVLAWLLIIASFTQLFLVYKNKEQSSTLLSLLSAIVMLVAGVLLILYPAHAVITLTLILSAYLLVQGLLQIIFAFTLRPLHTWWWMLLSGVVAILLAIAIWTNWPVSALSFLGIMLGVYLLVWGISISMLSLSVRKLQK